ncbi:MAG TPA: hypothetical protein P5511_09245, partial [Candidatus Goldiibacteriota bacterium]|nr:hypothetical protein [Candidatus Goldiibacteriota bacterium]
VPTGTLIGSAWYVTFTAGQATLTDMSFRRAGSARLFVSTVQTDTPDLQTGIWGISTAITVSPGTVNRMQIIPPGMTARPGTAAGITGTPLGQVVADTFTVTVNACDTWWNIITSGVGATDSFQLTTSDNANAWAARTGQTLARPPITNGALSAGSALMDVRYDVFTTNFTISVSSYRGGVSAYTTPFIYIFDVDHFTIKGESTVNISDQQVGVPFTITITAYDAVNNIMTGFSGISVALRSSNQYSDSEYTLTPTKSVTFTAGVAVMQVTMYRAQTSFTGAGVFIETTFGNKKSQSNNFNLWWGPVTNVLVRTAGMTHKPGLAHVGIPGYKGYEGSPITVEAGQQFQVEVLYLDSNYNRVWTLPTTYCKLTSSDPLASDGAIQLASGNVHVTITAGIYQTSSFRLRTVGTS